MVGKGVVNLIEETAVFVIFYHNFHNHFANAHLYKEKRYLLQM